MSFGSNAECLPKLKHELIIANFKAYKVNAIVSKFVLKETQYYMSKFDSEKQ